MLRAATSVLVSIVVQACGAPSAPQIAGTWSGLMEIDGGAGARHAKVAVTFTQKGSRVEGQWRSLDAALDAGGLVSGTVTREDARQPMHLRFTYTGPHPVKSTPGATCVGAAESEGQLVYNTTVDTSGQPPPEQAGWGIRLKAFKGFTFESCPGIAYATWTLTR